GARDFIYGSLITGLGALLVGTPLAVAIALYLNELAPRQLRTVITALVELLAAIPSVVLGLFGIIVLGPFVKDYLYPALSSVLGFGRGVGEAIAVTQVIGGASRTHYWSLFNTGDTLASRIAANFQSATSNIEAASLLYLGAILLVVSLIVNLLAQLVILKGAE